jgi:hypothetical protein
MNNVPIGFNRTNFHSNTFCEFTEVDVLPANISKPHFKSKSGSAYYFTDEGVYRSSNHWGRAANCRWRLITTSKAKINNAQQRIGFAKWTDFYPNNESDALFYIAVNFETATVTFQHKNHPNYDGKVVLRKAAETAKVMRQIKEVLETDAWAKYYNTTNIDSLRRDIIDQLCFSALSLSEIRRNLLAHSHGK